MRWKATFLSAILLSAASPALAGHEVYVPVGSADQVLVIDQASDTVKGRITGTEATHGLAAVSGGKYLIAGSYAELDGNESGTPAKPAGMSENEHQAHHAKPAVSRPPAGGASSVVSIIRTQDMKVVRRITVPGAVHHVETTPDGRQAIVTHPNEGAISVIDLQTFEATKPIPIGPQPNYVVAAGDGKTVYVSVSGNNTVSEVDIEAGVVRRYFKVGSRPEHLVLSADGKRLYVVNVDGGTVSVLSLESGTLVRTFRIGGSLHGIDLSDDGKTLFVAAREQGKLVAIDLATGKKRMQPLSPQPYHLTTIGGTGKLYVSSAEEDKIWVVDQRNLLPVKEIPVPDRAHQMVVVKH